MPNGHHRTEVEQDSIVGGGPAGATLNDLVCCLTGPAEANLATRPVQEAGFRHDAWTQSPRSKSNADAGGCTLRLALTALGCSQWTKQCLPCQRSKVMTHIKAPLEEYTPPSGRFVHVNIHLVGPMVLSNGITYVLTVVDRFTRWPIAILIPDKAAMTVARAFLSGWVANFGMPTDALSDRGHLGHPPRQN
jgi:hypothetical protein